MNKQKIVLKELFDSGEKRTPRQVASATGLKMAEVYEALRNLERRKLITKNKIVGKAGYKSPPKGIIYANINEFKMEKIRKLIRGAE